MEIKQLIIENWKSIVHLELNNPNPFNVFVGPNASGKSNIFEALEFVTSVPKLSSPELQSLFGGAEQYLNRKLGFSVPFAFNELHSGATVVMNHEWYNNKIISRSAGYTLIEPGYVNGDSELHENKFLNQFITCFSRIFIKNTSSQKIEFNDDRKLSTACGNLEKVLKRILRDENKKQEIIEWLQLLIPGFENIEIKSEELSGTDALLIYEKGTEKPFSKSLISDGTYNILALLTAAYQSNEPQFLLIEEPENGLNPKVVQELVNLFRYRCEEYGDFIWLNTHSQTLIRQLREEEIILVDKKEGETIVTQIKKGDASGLPMDEALLTNTFGGGIPW